MLRTSYVAIDREVIKCAALYRKVRPDVFGKVADIDADAYETFLRAKQTVDTSRIVMEFTDDLIPSHASMWDSLDQFVLCSDRIVDDSVGIANLRNWVQRGGHLWVFLDRVQPSTVEAIVGHSLCYQVVDRVELDEFAIEGFRSLDSAQARDNRRFEKPVEFVRVVTDSPDVPCRVNHWPAAFYQRVGAGEVLFVALGPRGWLPAPIRPGDEQLPESNQPEFRGAGALEDLAKHFFLIRPDPPPVQAVIQPILQEQIGYQIPRRAFAATLLGLNSLGLIAVGSWLAVRKRLDNLVWVLPVFAVTTTIVFLVIGRQNSKSVPPSVAFTQLVRMFPDTEEATVSGLAGLYHQESSPLTMSGGAGGIVQVMTESTGGAIRRLVWGDRDRGYWQNVTLPGGSIQFIDFRKPTRLSGSIDAVAQFGPRGVEGRVAAGALGTLQDSVIANTPGPSLHVKMRPDGTFVSGPSDVLAEGQFTDDRVLSDDARRRQAIYRQTVSVEDIYRLGRGPNLLGWAAPFSCGIDWPSELQQTGAAMIAIPLRFERTPSGKPFLVPATFLQAKAASNESGQSMSYNDRTGVWLKSVNRATRTALRFPLPAEVLPCEVHQARLTIKLSAPSRKLRVFSVLNREEHLVNEVANPSGVYKFDVDKPTLLPTEVTDSLSFTIEITESDAERVAREERRKLSDLKSAPSTNSDGDGLAQLANSFSTWQIDFIQLDVSGVVK